MSEAKPLTAEEIAEWQSNSNSPIARRFLATLDQRDEQIKRLRKLLIERGAASEALAVTEKP